MGWMDGRMDGCMDGMDGWQAGWIHGWDGWMGWMDEMGWDGMDGWMDGWMHASARARACIQPASRARACIMHAESGCTQIRSCTVCMPNLGGPRSLVATCTHQGLIRDEALRSILVTCSTIISSIYNEIKCAHAELVLHTSSTAVVEDLS